MRIYLTGASGGIGSAIQEQLKEHDCSLNPDVIDWLIFAHGVIDENDFEETFNVNTFKCILRTQSLIDTVKQGVIYISSTAALNGNDSFPIYAASKAAVNSYTKSMARKYPDKQFYALCPGPTNTQMWQKLGLEGEAQEPVEVAKAIQRILSGEFKSGDIITVRNGEVLCV